MPAVSARLGQADTNVTARVYSHALLADDQRAADAWAGVISEKSPCLSAMCRRMTWDDMATLTVGSKFLETIEIKGIAW